MKNDSDSRDNAYWEVKDDPNAMAASAKEKDTPDKIPNTTNQL